MAHPIVRRSSPVLIEAIEEVDVAKVKDLLEAGINVHARDDTDEGFTALHHAIFAENQEILTLLLEHGAYVDHSSPGGIYPLDIAFSLKQVECIMILIKYHARVNLRIFYYLLLDFQEGDLSEEIHELFYQHVSMNDRDKLGYSVLLKAAQYGDRRGIELLMNRGANVNIRKLGDGQTPLHIAARQGKVDCIELLLKHGARPDLKDEFGHTPLHALVHAPIPEIAKVQVAHLLLEFGGDVNVECNINQVALHHATEVTECLQQVIIQHIAMMQHKGDHVSEANCELISNNGELRSFHEECVEELENIEKDIVTDRVRMCEFLYNSEQLISFTRNVDVERAFKYHHYKHQYPIFYGTLNRNFNIALRKSKHFDSAALALNSLMPQIRSNSIATEKILGFLNENDIANLESVGLSNQNNE